MFFCRPSNGERTLIGESLAGLFIVETFLNALEKLRQLPLQGQTLYPTVGGIKDNTQETSGLADTLRAMNPRV